MKELKVIATYQMTFTIQVEDKLVADMGGNLEEAYGAEKTILDAVFEEKRGKHHAMAFVKEEVYDGDNLLIESE